MLYDLKQIIDGGETNYITATLALYLDLFNIFQSLLMILGHHVRRRLTSRPAHPKKKGPFGPFSLQLEDRDRLRRAPCAGTC
jgi:hypothetical protein